MRDVFARSFGVRRRSRFVAVAFGAAVVLAAFGATGCGSPSPDLFEVIRTGADRNANVDMVVNDGGAVTCNREQHPLPAPDLLRARALVRALEPQAQLNLSLPPGPSANLSYRVRQEAGTITFTDTSKAIPSSFQQLAAFTKDVSENVCGLQR
jgi:hypothetical protein